MSFWWALMPMSHQTYIMHGTLVRRVAKGRGLGDRVQTVIHAGLDITPMPAKTRAKIKSCGGCAKRKAMLNKAGSVLSSLFSTKRP